MRKVLITGGDGNLSKEIVLRNNGEFTFTTPSSVDMDITSIDDMYVYISENNPDIIIHTAALTKPMSLHEVDINKSIEVNIIGTANLVKICKSMNIKLIYISTDYVYPLNSVDVKEDDGLFPINNYGWSKLGGECSVKMYENSLIIRLSFSEKPFIHKFAYTNVIKNHLYIDEASKLVLSVIDEYGIINLGVEDNHTLYEFASKTNKNVKPSVLTDNESPNIMTLNVNKMKNTIKNNN